MFESMIISNTEHNESGNDIFYLISHMSQSDTFNLHGERFFDMLYQSVLLDIDKKNITTENFTIVIHFGKEEGSDETETLSRETSITEIREELKDKKFKSKLVNGLKN